jgi:3-dehydroquinate synthase
MSETFGIQSYRGEYRVHFTGDIAKVLDEQVAPADLVVMDRVVHELYPALSEALSGRTVMLMDATEEAKSFDQVAPLIQTMIDRNMGKGSRLIAVGGGVVQDLVSFTASIFKRGSDWVFVPTTLLAQCDSCIGSKTSINFRETKNQLGSFHAARAIYIDTRFLKTLPAIELRAGLGEMFHYFLVSGDEDYRWAAERVANALTDDAILHAFISRSLSIKKAMIERDEFDAGPRNVFNYGHTFGHALEVATHYAVPHGIAVAIGMELANRVSVRMGLLDEAVRRDVHGALRHIWSPDDCPAVETAAYWGAIRQDKKNIGNQINVILTRGIGDMFKTPLPDDEGMVAFIDGYFQGQEWLKP